LPCPKINKLITNKKRGLRSALANSWKPEWLLGKVVAAAHTFDAPLAVHDSLFAGVKRVALATYLNAERRFGGASLEDVPAGTGHGSGIKPGVDFCLHLLVRTCLDRIGGSGELP
jgi:hypothetical protein